MVQEFLQKRVRKKGRWCSPIRQGGPVESRSCRSPERLREVPLFREPTAQQRLPGRGVEGGAADPVLRSDDTQSVSLIDRERPPRGCCTKDCPSHCPRSEYSLFRDCPRKSARSPIPVLPYPGGFDSRETRFELPARSRVLQRTSETPPDTQQPPLALPQESQPRNHERARCS